MTRCQKRARNAAQRFFDKMVRDMVSVYSPCARPWQYLLTNEASHVVTNNPLFSKYAGFPMKIRNYPSLSSPLNQNRNATSINN